MMPQTGVVNKQLGDDGLPGPQAFRPLCVVVRMLLDARWKPKTTSARMGQSYFQTGSVMFVTLDPCVVPGSDEVERPVGTPKEGAITISSVV